MESKSDVEKTWDELEHRVEQLLEEEKGKRANQRGVRVACPPFTSEIMAKLCKVNSRIIKELWEAYPSQLSDPNTATPWINDFYYQEISAKLACWEVGLEEGLWYPIYLLHHWWNDFESWADDVLGNQT